MVAPVFDHHHRRHGVWIELACARAEADACANQLLDHLQRAPTAWLFVTDAANTLTPYLPLALDCEQFLVRSARAVSPTSDRRPDGLGLALRGTQAEIANDQDANWHVVTDASGAVGGSAGSVHAMADGLSGWQACKPLIELGWQAFMMTGNQRLGKKQPKADQLALTRLLNLVTRDADIDELEALFKIQPKLAFDLLNLVNSPALNLRTPATNFRHAITLLGRRQLQRWLQLLMFTRQTSLSEVNILRWHSAFRGRIMERLATRLEWPAETIDQAFMVGVFSLLDVLLGDSLDKLLTPLSLPEELLAALLKQQGPLGELLGLAKAIETRDSETLNRLSRTFHAHAPMLLDLQLESLFWVESLSSPAAT